MNVLHKNNITIIITTRLQCLKLGTIRLFVQQLEQNDIHFADNNLNAFERSAVYFDSNCPEVCIGSDDRDDVIKWKHFPRYWPFVRGIHRSPVNSPHKGPWRGALMFSLICARIKGWVNNREADDLKRQRAHYDITVMMAWCFIDWFY